MRRGSKIAIGVGVLVLGGAIGAGCGNGNPITHNASAPATAPAPTTSTTPTTTPTPTPAPAPAPAPAPVTHTLTFGTSGSTDATVTYGTAGSNSIGQVPMNVTIVIPNPAPLFYVIDAQLHGDGQVSVWIQVDGKTLSSGVATGGYNIADAQISQNPLTGQWVDTHTGA